MDTEQVIVLSMAIAGLTLVGGLVVNMVMAAVARFKASERAAEQGAPSAPLDERLARIEVAVETIALEVERLGELQRFNAKLEAQRLPEPRDVARPVTPH